MCLRTQMLVPFFLVMWQHTWIHYVIKKVNKQVEGKIKKFKFNQGSKNKKAEKLWNEQLKSCKTREVPTCRYTSGYLIPNSVNITETEVGIKCPLVYLQVNGTSLVSQLCSSSLVSMLFCSLILIIKLKIKIYI